MCASRTRHAMPVARCICWGAHGRADILDCTVICEATVCIRPSGFRPRTTQLNDLAKNLLLWVVIALVLMSVFSSFAPSSSSANSIAYSQFLEQVKDGNVARVHMEGPNITGCLSSGQKVSTYSPETDNKAMIGTLLQNKVQIVGEPPNQGSFFKQILISWFPFILLIGVWIYFMRQMQGGGGGRGAMSFGKSKARMMAADQIKI